jgi:cytochrome b6-f complex subunit 8
MKCRSLTLFGYANLTPKFTPMPILDIEWKMLSFNFHLIEPMDILNFGWVAILTLFTYSIAMVVWARHGM